ncbi:MAG: hypothetical protein ACR2PT_18195 [Endozoicomonas sp.]
MMFYKITLMQGVFKRYLGILLIAPMLMGPTDFVTEPDNSASELVSSVSASQSTVAESLGFPGDSSLPIKYSLSVESVSEWDRYIEKFDTMSKETQPLSWNYEDQRYEEVTPEELSKLSYDVVDLSEASQRDIKKYVRTLKDWSSDFDSYQLTGDMPEAAADKASHIASVFASKLAKGKLSKLYLLNTTSGTGRKLPLSIIGTQDSDLELAYSVS